MAGRKSQEVQAAVTLVVSGKCDVYEAAQKTGVVPSSIYRDAEYRAWLAAQQKGEKKS